MSLLASLMLLATAPANAASPDAAAPVSTCDALAGEEIVATAASGACRVSGHLQPVKGSDIGFALWLPAQWNGRFLMLGNGGYASAMPLEQMTRALAKGYAVAATDTGHQGDDPSFALGHPEAIADWGWRAVHETARKAQSLTRTYYGRASRWRYFNGCSTGGHQALSEAQRFPRDFDGIVAGAPGYDRVRLNAGFLWMFLSNHRRGDNLHPILEQSQLDLLARHTLLRCGKPGAGWLDHPGACHADPGALLCRPGQREACLTGPQVTAARAIYAGPHDERHRPVFFGQAPGTERQWSLYWSDPQDRSIPMRASFWQIWAGEGQAWNWWNFSFGRDLKRARELCRPASMPTVPICRLSRRRGQVAAMAWAGRSRGAFCRYAGLSGKGAGAHGGRFAFLPSEAAARCGPLRVAGRSRPLSICRTWMQEAWVEAGSAPS
jgi:feruloyl esterase